MGGWPSRDFGQKVWRRQVVAQRSSFTAGAVNGRWGPLLARRPDMVLLTPSTSVVWRGISRTSYRSGPSSKWLGGTPGPSSPPQLMTVTWSAPPAATSSCPRSSRRVRGSLRPRGWRLFMPGSVRTAPRCCTRVRCWVSMGRVRWPTGRRIDLANPNSCGGRTSDSGRPRCGVSGPPGPPRDGVPSRPAV